MIGVNVHGFPSDFANPNPQQRHVPRNALSLNATRNGRPAVTRRHIALLKDDQLETFRCVVKSSSLNHGKQRVSAQSVSGSFVS
jgi:hypothetical protein